MLTGKDANREKALARAKRLMFLGTHNTIEAEAASAINKAREIMLRYAISEQELGLQDNDPSIIEVKVENMYPRQGRKKWESLLNIVVAEHFGCRIVSNEYATWVVGHKDMAEAASFSINNIRWRIEEASKTATVDYVERTANRFRTMGIPANTVLTTVWSLEGNQNPNAFKRDWLVGCVKGIEHRLESQREKEKSAKKHEEPEEPVEIAGELEEKPLDPSTVTALVARRDLELKEYVNNKWPGKGTVVSGRRKRGSTNQSAYQIGYAKGRNISIQSALEEKTAGALENKSWGEK